MITILPDLILPIIAHTGCMGSISSTTVTVIKPIAASNGILSGEHNCEFHAPTIMITLIMMRLCFNLSW